MSREIRRVPLDFDFPLGETWTGYLRPDELDLPQCPTCKGDGYSVEARAIAETFYPHQIGWGAAAEALAWCDKIGQAEVDNLIAKGRLAVWRDGKWNNEPRTAAEVNALQRSPQRGLDGHDGINRWILIEFRCERLGIELKCPTCSGDGVVATEEQRAAHEAWEPTEHPTGPGYQLWQTVSEGGPVSPVFPTPAGLADWIIASGKDLHGSNVPRSKLVAWIAAEGHSAGSFAFIDGRHVSGVELAAVKR